MVRKMLAQKVKNSMYNILITKYHRKNTLILKAVPSVQTIQNALLRININ